MWHFQKMIMVGLIKYFIYIYIMRIKVYLVIIFKNSFMFLIIENCCKLRVMNDHIDGHYELHLLIFKMSNGSS